MTGLVRLAALFVAMLLAAGCDGPTVTHLKPQHRPADGMDMADGTLAAVPDAPGAALAAAGPLTVSMSRCEKARCELTFTFSRAVVPAPRKGRSGAVTVAFEPAQPGRWEWTSPTRLVFRPGPGALQWGHKARVKVSRATPLEGAGLETPWHHTFRVPYFQAAGKVARWPVVDGRPRFVAFLNGRGGQIGAGPLYLLYDQPVAPGRVRRAIRLSSGTKAVALDVRRPGSLDHIYSGAIDSRLVVAVAMKQKKGRALPADGARVALQYPKLLDGSVPQVATRSFEVHTDFALQTIRPDNMDGDRMPRSARIALGFNSPVSAGAVQKAVSISPAPRSMRVSWVWGSGAYVMAELDPGRSYKMSVAANMRDELGNRLGKAHTLGFTAHDLQPRLALPKEPMTLERGHARVPVRAVNTDALEARFQAVATPAEYIALLRARKPRCPSNAAEASRTFSLAPASRRNVETTRSARLDIKEKLGSLGCLQVSTRGTGSLGKHEHLQAALPVQVTGLGVTAKIHAQSMVVWAARLASAEPVAGAAVTLTDEHGNTLSRAITDASGLATMDSSDIASRAGLAFSGYLVVESNDDRAVVAVAESRLSQPWQFGMRGTVKDVAELSAAVFTDRGVYRPDETVHLKILARDAEGRSPARGKVDVLVSDPRGKKVLQKSLQLDAYGTTQADIQLAKNAAVGRYAVRISQGDRVAAEKFLVEEYRVPTFHVDVTTDQPLAANQDAHATIAARYHHGGIMAARSVRYSVARDSVAFSPAGYPGYVFARTGDEQDSTRTAQGIIKRGETRLDGQGRLVVDFNTTHPSTAGPMRYVVDASVTDVDRQVYKGRLQQVIHPATLYVGVRPAPERILAAGDVIEVPVVAVAPDGRARAGISARVALERVDHHTTARLAGTSRASGSPVELRSRPVTRVVERCTVRTRARPVVCKLRVPRAGQYRVVAQARDDRRARVESSFAFTAAGRHTIAWPRFAHERIDVIADRTSYQPGETAHIMVQSPFARARGVLTLERGAVIEHKLFAIDHDAPVIDVPITAAHAPNVYASVVLFQPRVHEQKDATGFETGAPSFRMGYAELRVAPVSHALDVEVSSKKTAHPRARLDIDILVRDRQGMPAAGQATVMVVDEAVLAMTAYRTPDPVAEIFSPKPLGVRTLTSVLDLPHSRRSRHEQIFVSGDGGPGFALSQLAPQMRTLFNSTAYWNPSVAIGADGRARVTVDLPDNVTTYRIMAVAAGAGARAGAGDARVLVRKPLMVQPVLPRFVHPGDTLRVEARVFNGTDDQGRVVIDSDFTGLVAMGEKQGRAAREVNVAPGDAATVGFPVTVSGADDARVRFVARMGTHQDAVEVSIPVLNPGTKRRVIVKQSVAGAAELKVDLPADRVPGSAEMEVLMSSTRLGELKGAVDYLMGYPNGCIEQTTSRAYPLVVLQDLLPDMGVTVDPARLREYAEAGVKRLLSFQTSAGGLAYWPGSDKAHAFGTAFGLTALIEAKKRGYQVPDDALARMADYLQEALGRGAITEEMPHGGMADADTRALFVMTLGRMGRPQPGHVSALWRARDKMTAFGLAFLAVAAGELAARDAAMVDAMLAEVRQKAREEAQEAYFDKNPAGGWSMDSPLRTHATALLAYAESAPTNDMLQKLLAGLLARQRNGLWGNTQENVFGIMAVAEAMKLRGTGKAEAPEIELFVNGAAVRQVAPMGTSGSRAVLGASMLDDAAGTAGTAATQTVRIENNAATPAHVTVRAAFDVALNARTMAARQNGFAIERSYERVDGRAVNPRAMKLGQLLRVRVRVTTRNKHNYVAIHDRLPAGLEPLNSNLATTETVDKAVLTPALARGLGVLSYSEVRDERVAFYADDLPAGTYEFTYLARATTPGTFVRPAASVEAMYQPEASGSSAIDHVVIQ